MALNQGTLVYIDGHRVSESDAKVSVFDRGLLYGDSVFETIATRGGRPFMLAEHVRRLRRSAELVFIDLRVDDQQVCGEVEQAVAASNNDECYVRLTLTRGVGDLGLDPELPQEPCRILIVAPLHRPPLEAYRSGIRAITYKTLRTVESTEASGAKIGNYLVAVLAMRRAKLARANEALIVNGDGWVVEGATSNLFFRVGEELLTPPVTAGILPGITRELVLEATQRLSWRLRYQCPTTDELYRADEVFITSSVRDMLAVVTIDDHAIGGGQPGPMYRELWQAYQALAREKLAAAPRLFVP
jgi:branched-chain amino acid aminotransferase